MKNNIESFLFLFDLIGPTPQLFIFNNKRYKSIFSSIFSLLVIFISCYFAIISLVEYLKFDDPMISYTKDNDEETIRSYSLNDLILIFQLVDSSDNFYFNVIDQSIASFVGYYIIVYNNGTILNYPLNIENCEFGKNIKKEFKETKFGDSKYTFGRKIEEFYCISNFEENYSLFHYPNYAFSYISLYIIFKNNSVYLPEDLQSLIVSENDIIDHSDKKEPIKKNYIFQFTGSYSASEFTAVGYDFQFINYESDEGYFTKNSKYLKGIAFSDYITTRNNNKDYNFKKNLEQNNYSIIGRIDLGISQSNFDNYKRNYKRLQTLLAEIMSVFSLLYEIGRQLSIILNQKKMFKDIFEIILNNNYNENNISLSYNHNKNIKIKKYLFNSKKKEIAPKKIKRSFKSSYTVKNNKNIYKVDNSNSNAIISNNNKNNNKNNLKLYNLNYKKGLLKKINYFHLIKSYFCFKDEISEFIDKFYSFVQDEICIETILSKIYKFEKFYYSSSKENFIENNLIKNNENKGNINNNNINGNNENKNQDNLSIKSIEFKDLISK